MPVRLVKFAAAGACWGGLAYLLAERAMGSVVWPGIVTAPALGVAVGAATQRAFKRSTGWRRWAAALASLYLGGMLFALVVGAYDSVIRFHGTHGIVSTMLETQAMVAWGITLTGFFLFLWPLAYFTHFVIEWTDRR